MDCFYAFDMWDADMRRQEEDYLAEQEYMEWSRKVEDEAYDQLILPAYFADKDASEKEEVK